MVIVVAMLMGSISAVGLGVLGLAWAVQAQLDFGESLESDKCSFRNFQQRTCPHSFSRPPTVRRCSQLCDVCRTAGGRAHRCGRGRDGVLSIGLCERRGPLPVRH